MSTNHWSICFRHACRVAVVIAFGCLPAAASKPAQTPAGTRVEARLLTPISTYTARSGMPVSAALASALCAGGAPVLPAGSELRGTVARVSRVGLGIVHETAGLQLDFDGLAVPGGPVYAVTSHLEGIDNARERVDRKGHIHGIRATATISNRLGERIAFAVVGHPGAMIPLFALETGFLHFPDPEIEFRRGTVLQLAVEFPSSLGDVRPCPMPQENSSPGEWDAMQNLVDMLPYWSYSKRQRQPMDLVNLLLVGSRDAVERTFDAAGWIGSRPNSMRAGMAAIRAIAENRSFSDAPMRDLLLDGEAPDFRLQKSLDTFEKRDHLRIWKRDGELDGESVWASAATRDLGTTFAMHPFGFTHEIQDDVDLERDKVVHDLVFTGCVDSVAYVRRPEGLRETGGNYRKGVSTDARVAMIFLNSCNQPREDYATVDALPQPGKTVRVIRRIMLTARNHFLRDNIFYRSADAARLTYLALRGIRQQAGQERRAEQLEVCARSGAGSN